MTVSAAEWALRAIDTAFNPRSVAVAGVSPGQGRMGGGRMFYEAIRKFGRVPHVYAINPKGGEMKDGAPLYRSLRAIPGDVDFVISAVPATAILDLVDDAIAKGVKVLHSFTAGFRETGDAQRVELEAEVMRRLQGAGIRLIGPNCMGVHSPIGGVTWMDDASAVVGRVGVISQSGMHATEVVQAGGRRAVRFSHVISMGNATDLNEGDYLDYFGAHDGTDIVLMYLEGVQDGPRFIQAARRVAAQKPLVILKGGLTESGSRAAASHTGSLAGSAAIWNAVEKQAGFVTVYDVEQVLDMAAAMQHLWAVRGPRVGIIGAGGGVSVLAADAADRAGLQVPWFAEATQRRLGEFTPVAGTSVRNPVDSNIMWDDTHFTDTFEAVAGDPNVDFIILHIGVDGGPSRRANNRFEFAERMATNAARAREIVGMPIALVLHPPATPEGFEIALRLQEQLGNDGFAVFPTIAAASTAVRRLLTWRAARRHD